VPPPHKRFDAGSSPAPSTACVNSERAVGAVIAPSRPQRRLIWLPSFPRALGELPLGSHGTGPVLLSAGVSLQVSPLWVCCRSGLLGFIDTGPAKLDLIEPAIVVADLVLIPTRPSSFDIEQAGTCTELCEAHGKRQAFVFNQAERGTKLTKSSMQYLEQEGAQVIKSPVITFQPAYMAALTVGKSGPEVEKDGDARKEIDALWAAVNKLLAERA
jgi:hypothetical protein